MDSKLGPESTVSSALATGAFAQFSSILERRSGRSSLIERADFAETARREMGKIMSKIKLNRPLHHAVQIACDCRYQPGDIVFLWRAKVVSTRTGERLDRTVIGFVDYDKKLVHVRYSTIVSARSVNVTQMKPYFMPAFLSDAFTAEVNRSLNESHSPPSGEDILFAEVLSPNDYRAFSTKMNETQRKDTKSHGMGNI